ncbi:MAG: beta-galactosidase, partial [Marinomonas sp.]
TGHPDFGAFHHDLYRGCGKGRLWIMEQQPGPVNWAPHNPTPADGAVRLWTWEAFSHGAELVSYFRWRQAPFAQEQMHSGLLRPDASKAEAAFEAQQVSDEINHLSQQLGLDKDELEALPSAGSVALMFDYDACWALDIQPQSQAYRYLFWCYRVYESLRELGLSIDIISPKSDLSAYKMLVLPAQVVIDDMLQKALDKFEGVLLVGPRSGSKTSDYQIPDELAPGKLQTLMQLQVERVDALPEHTQPSVNGAWGQGQLKHWREQINTELAVHLEDEQGQPVLVGEDKRFYLGACLDKALLKSCFEKLAGQAELPVYYLPKGVRVRHRGKLIFVFNYGQSAANYVPLGATCLIGQAQVAPAGVSIWLKS